MNNEFAQLSGRHLAYFWQSSFMGTLAEAHDKKNRF